MGATDSLGVPPAFSQGGPLLTVSANGVYCPCAAATGNTAVKISGTSIAAATVAGLVAYFLSVPKYQPELNGEGGIQKNMINLLKGLSYKRVSGTVSTVFNGIDWVDPDSCPAYGPLPKRGACC